MGEIIALGKWEQAKRAIAECKNIDELKQIRNKAQALKAYAKQARESLEVQNNVAEIKIRAERRIGEFSKELPIGRGKVKMTPHDGESFKTDILKQAGIRHAERYEAIANLPEKDFEEHIKRVKQSNEELTTVGLIKLARQDTKSKYRKTLAKSGENIFLPQQIDLRLGDFRKVLKDIKKVDLILTDPPYPKEYLPLWKDLDEFANNKLKDGGYLIAYSGQYHLPEVFNSFKHLDYVWTFCLYHEGKTQIVNSINVICRWKPVLIFQKGKRKFSNTMQDYIKSEVREKEHHKWQQGLSAIKGLIELFSDVGNTICDPFSGASTVGMACKELKRNFIGAEINKENYNISKKRLE